MEFESRLTACRQELVAYCRHLLWSRQDFEDALQEVVLQAWRAWPRYSAGDFKAWLFTVATNTIFNFNRKHRAHEIPAPPPGDADVDVELGLEEAYDSILRNPSAPLSDLSGAMRDGLMRLNETERAVFLLRSICELKYQEIAATLSIPMGSVIGNLARARVRLRRFLAERSHAM